MTRAFAAPAVLFALLCLVWGSNWLVVKLAVADVPPLAFAAARSLVAGAVMLALAGPRNVLALVRAAPGATLATALLANTLTYAGLYWGTARVSTGVAAIVNNALMPMGLAAFGLALREEAFSARRVAGIALGAIGLGLLFYRRSDGALDVAAVAGIAALTGGTLAYCLGSVLSRPLLSGATPMTVGAAQALAGGLMLVPAVATIEQSALALPATFAPPLAAAALAWLVLAGSVLGGTIYLRLIRDWGPSRAGMYAFVAPIVATLLGAAVLGERLGALEALGGAIMLAAAALVLPARPGTAGTDAA